MPGTMSGSVRSAARMSPLFTLFSSSAERRKRTVPCPAPREAPLPSTMISASVRCLGSTSRRRMKMVCGCCSRSSFQRVSGRACTNQRRSEASKQNSVSMMIPP